MTLIIQVRRLAPSLSTKALIHNWLPGPGDLEGSTNYGVDCSKIPPPSKDGESPSNLIPFHSIPRVGGGHNGEKNFIALFHVSEHSEHFKSILKN